MKKVEKELFHDFDSQSTFILYLVFLIVKGKIEKYALARFMTL